MKPDNKHQLTEKGANIRSMFDTIAPRYDLLNRLLSLGIDRTWRTKAVARLRIPRNGRVLDIATGTGDVALEIARQTDPSVQIVGEDFTQGMLDIAVRKVADSPYAGRISFANAPCEDIPDHDNSFDGCTIAFGIRNVVDRELGLQEIHRVLKPGGRLVILEFSIPTNPLFRAIYHFYFKHLLPKIGGLFSKQSAYQYLPDSVMAFPSRDEFRAMMQKAGFIDTTCTDLTFGIVSIYTADKRAD